MWRFNAVGLVILLGFLSGVSSKAGAYPAPADPTNPKDKNAVEAGMILLEKARYALWTAEGSLDNAASLLDQAHSTFSSISDNAARTYLLARVELYRGKGFLEILDKGRARGHFQRSMELAEESLEYRETSEAFRVLSDAGSSWMITKGLGGIIRMAPKVQKWSDQALELDDTNALATLISAQGQINAPKGSGGDPQEAVNRLLRLHERLDLDDIERFWTRLSLSQAYNKLKKPKEAASWCEQASLIFPENPMLKNCP